MEASPTLSPAAPSREKKTASRKDGQACNHVLENVHVLSKTTLRFSVSFSISFPFLYQQNKTAKRIELPEKDLNLHHPRYRCYERRADLSSSVSNLQQYPVYEGPTF